MIEYTQFQATYFGYLMSLMNLDTATLSLGITVAAMTPLIGIGQLMITTGTAMVAQGTAMVASIVGAAVGTTMIGNGVSLIAAGYSQIALATAAISSAGLAQMFAGLTSIFAGTAAVNTAGYGSVDAVRKKEYEYQQAQSELDYLTKVPDLETLKERFKNYGTENEDPEDAAYDLYNLSDEDLVYLLEMVGGTENYAGATPTTEERSEALDITGKQNDVEYRDSAGRRYDPTTYTTTQPAPLNNGSYGGYTRVLVQGHDRDNKHYGYFQIIDETADSQIAYDMGEVLDSMLNHGNALREDRKNRYIDAGNAAATTDSTFVFRERDATYENLFEEATDRTNGGREFAGYRTTFADYAGNQNEVFDRELQQRQQVQTAEWNLREQELNDRYADWEARMNTIVSQGQSKWGNSENIFLQEKREWEREMAEDRAAAEALWAQREQEHFAAKADWEAQVRSQVTEGNVEEALAEAVDNMNAQITTMNANMGTDLETQNRNALIAQAIDELRRDEPSEAEKLAKINESIAKFNTNVTISELTGTNLSRGLGSITGQYREAMRTQRHDMQVYANAKIFEQYQLLVDDLLEQIKAQNRATEARTIADAASEGFTKQGAVFLKADTGGKSFAVVNEFVGFDGVTAIQEEQTRAGAMHGVRAGGEPSAFDNSAIVAFLKSADSIQVESFFDYQRKAFEVVAERIMGEGTSEERQATFQPNETVHGRLGVWIGRPADQQVTQGLIQAAAGSYYDDQEALKNVAQSATGYGELGASTVRPSQLGVGFYTQLWYYGQIMGQRQSETINATYNEGILATGAAKFYNTYNPFTSFGNSYATGKLNKELYGTDQANFWRNEILSSAPMFKANQQTGELTTSFSQQEWIGLIPAIGGLINSGINYDDRGRQRGGWKWNPRAAGAATVSGVAGAALSIYGTPVGEYINQQMYGEEHSNYASLGVNKGFGSFISAAGGAIAAAFAMEASNADFDQGESVSLEDLDIAEGANKMGQTHSGAGIFQGAGYSIGLRRYGHYLQRQLTGVGMGVVDGNGFTGVGASLKSLAGTAANGLLGVFSTLGSVTGVTERLGNFFSEDFNGDRWNWEADQQQRQRGINQTFQYLAADDSTSARRVMTEMGFTTEQQRQIELDQTRYDVGDAAYLAASMLRNNGIDPKTKAGDQRQFTELEARLGEIAAERGRPNSQLDVERVVREFAGERSIEPDWDLTFSRAEAMKGTDITQERMIQQIAGTRNITRQQAIDITYDEGVEFYYDALKTGQEVGQRNARNIMLTERLARSLYEHKVAGLNAGLQRATFGALTFGVSTSGAVLGSTHGNGPAMVAGGIGAAFGLSEWWKGMQDIQNPLRPAQPMALQTFSTNPTAQHVLGRTQQFGMMVGGAGLSLPTMTAGLAAPTTSMLGRLYQGAGGNLAVANGTINATNSIVVEQLMRPDLPLLSTETAITATGGFVAGAATVHGGGIYAGGVNAAVNRSTQYLNSQLDPNYKFNAPQLVATSLLAGHQQAMGNWIGGGLKSYVKSGEYSRGYAFGLQQGISSAAYFGRWVGVYALTSTADAPFNPNNPKNLLE